MFWFSGCKVTKYRRNCQEMEAKKRGLGRCGRVRQKNTPCRFGKHDVPLRPLWRAVLAFTTCRIGQNCRPSFSPYPSVSVFSLFVLPSFLLGSPFRGMLSRSSRTPFFCCRPRCVFHKSSAFPLPQPIAPQMYVLRSPMNTQSGADC